MDSRKVGVMAGGEGGVKSSFIFDIMWMVTIYGPLSMDEHCLKYLVHINSIHHQHREVVTISSHQFADEETEVQRG